MTQLFQDLEVQPPIAPMLCERESTIPEGDEWSYEPKYDGFRTIVYRSGDNVELGSRNQKPLTRYFPELVEILRKQLPDGCVVDGEIVMVDQETGLLDFEMLGQRVHPADSRVQMLAEKTPASLVVFDILAVNGKSVMKEPFSVRRKLLEKTLAKVKAPIAITPITQNVKVAQRWFDELEAAGTDGIVAKRNSTPYMQDKRVLVKIKHERTADCVVVGFRWHKDGESVGSLLLGLYDNNNELQHVGVCSGFSVKRRAEFTEFLAPYRSHERTVTKEPSRWTGDKDLSFEQLRIELVVEVAYEHLQGGRRIRHATQFKRWRPDREPSSCRFDQLEEPPASTFADVLGASD